MNTKLVGFVIVIVLIAGVGFIVFGRKDAPLVEAPTTTSPVAEQAPLEQASSTSPELPAPAAPAMYTLAQVQEHNSKTDCWTTISGSVYNLTDWIGNHPGGQQAIMGICGKDGTAAFKGQHGDNKQQNDILATFLIGVLVQ